jgi:hypothetical protein
VGQVAQVLLVVGRLAATGVLVLQPKLLVLKRTLLAAVGVLELRQLSALGVLAAAVMVQATLVLLLLLLAQQIPGAEAGAALAHLVTPQRVRVAQA